MGVLCGLESGEWGVVCVYGLGGLVVLLVPHALSD